MPVRGQVQHGGESPDRYALDPSDAFLAAQDLQGGHLATVGKIEERLTVMVVPAFRDLHCSWIRRPEIGGYEDP